ncbi:MAG: FHA domain-containing protein [Deltaproteobacteria bacterium]|nr:MAG: FHA domain-containing protein [Deltaproteobacteria bacterium]
MADLTGKAPVITVQISDGQTVEVRCRKGEILIGRSRECNLILPDPSVSRRHARVVGTDLGFFIEDTSTNGTFIDGEKIDRRTITTDTDVSIGPYLLHFRFFPVTGEGPGEKPTEVMAIRAEGKLAGKRETERGKISSPPEEDVIPDLGIVGKSSAILKVISMMKKMAKTDFPILITGETGTGKELIARGIHLLSQRRDNPYVVLNCGAISPELVESELFGHEKGAFTGAHTQRRGAFEIAQGGTLFLDEIGEMPIDLQPKLLRALEQKEIRRVGGNRTITVNVRIIAATNRNLQSEIRAKRFRQDLFYRLNSLPLIVPPLRERREDIPLLAEHFLAGFNREYSESKRLTRKALEVLTTYSWPGNVRELKNIIQRAAVLSEGDEVDGPLISSLLSGDGFLPPEETLTMGRDEPIRKVDAYEREIILRELEKTGWNKTQAARNLGIAKSTLFDKLKKYGITSSDNK